MHFSSIFRQKNTYHRLNSLRFMSRRPRAPRIYPGGLNAWQWKRMLDRKAREKEIPPVPADPFMKEGAEDLWNEDDGLMDMPPSEPEMIQKPIALKKLTPKKRTLLIGESSNGIGNFTNYRCFSTYASRIGDVSSGIGGLRSFGLVGSLSNLHLMRYHSVGASRMVREKPKFVRNDTRSGKADDPRQRSGKGGGSLWPRFTRDRIKSDDESEDEEEEEVFRRRRGSDDIDGDRAEVGEYGMKKNKRIALKFLEDEDDFSGHVQAIRREINKRKAMQEEEEKEAAQEVSILSSKRFDECGLSSLTVQALAEAGYEQMTNVQEGTLAACLDGKDVLVKAKAGTGNSIAYLLPAIETVLKASNSGKVRRISPIYVLILCPTRELASQISAKANVLLKHHHGIGVQTLVGGTRFKEDQKHLQSDPCQIIVATPGRLLDHIENKSGISLRLMGLQMLVLDEAKDLLDLGFRKDIERIIDCLPRKRQSLLFSPIIPKEVRQVSQLVFRKETVYIETSGVGCLETSYKFKQFYLVAPHDEHLEIVHHILKNHKSQVPEYKIVIFCATAMMASLTSSLLRAMNFNVRELHSKKSPWYCTKVFNEFKESKELILVTSDVEAQGMNYPDVSLVVQVGIPLDRWEYMSKIGRTGRQEKEGVGIMLLAPWEQYFLDEIKDLPLEKFPVPDLSPYAKAKIEASLQKIENNDKEEAYHAWLGYYKSISPIARDKASLVEYANQFSASIGLPNPPAMFRRTVIKMGLKDVPGIKIRK